MLTVQSHQRGFTLIEAMIAIAVLAVLLVMALPVAREFMLNQRIRTAAEAFQNGLQYARAQAIQQNTKVEFVVGAGSTWVVQLASDATQLRSRPSEEGTVGVVVVATPGDATKVTFDGFGRTTPNTPVSSRLTRLGIDLDSSLLPAAKTRELQIDIGVGGETRMCDPNVSDTADSRYCS